MNVFEVHTNFTSTTKRIYKFDLSDLDRNQPTATLLLIEPVLMRPLEHRWAEVQTSILTVLGVDSGLAVPTSSTPSQVSSRPTNGSGETPVLALRSPATNSVILSGGRSPQSKDPEAPGLATTSETIQTRTPKSHSLLRSNPEAERLLSAWLDELTAVRVLDPACGSGNFLYLALRRLLDLWLEAQRFAAAHDISLVLPKMVYPTQLYGANLRLQPSPEG